MSSAAAKYDWIQEFAASYCQLSTESASLRGAVPEDVPAPFMLGHLLGHVQVFLQSIVCQAPHSLSRLLACMPDAAEECMNLPFVS